MCLCIANNSQFKSVNLSQTIKVTREEKRKQKHTELQPNSTPTNAREIRNQITDKYQTKCKIGEHFGKTNKCEKKLVRC